MLRTVALVAGVLGGLCWLVRLGLDLAGAGQPTLVEGLGWVGLALVGVALAGVGIGLVGKSEAWLRAIVAVAFPLLVWSVLEVFRTAGDPVVVDAVLGSVVLALCALRLARRDAPAVDRRHHGAHSR